MQKNLRSFILVAGCCLGLLALPVAAHAQKFYFDVDGGIAFAEDVKLNRFVDPTPGAKLKLEAGPRLSLAAGWHFNDYVGAQLETGFIINEVKNLNGGHRSDAALAHVPLLADVVVRYDKPNCRWVPYAGVGAGGDSSIISLDYVRGPGGQVVDGSAGTEVFAWQAFAGVRYKFNRNMSIGAGYKFFSADAATWELEHTSADIRTGTARVHSVVVDFTMKF